MMKEENNNNNNNNGLVAFIVIIIKSYIEIECFEHFTNTQSNHFTL